MKDQEDPVVETVSENSRRLKEGREKIVHGMGEVAEGLKIVGGVLVEEVVKVAVDRGTDALIIVVSAATKSVLSRTRL